jgi:predicted Zn finger-like uncharacterized protein
MEPFEIACPHCDGKLRVAAANLLGRKVKCPKCREPFTVPTEEDLEIATRELEEEASIGVGVGPGVGSGVGSSVGGSKLGRSSISGFSVRPSPEAEDVEEAEEEDAGPYRSPRSGGTPGRRPPPNPIQGKNLAMVVGLPVALLLFGSLFIFWSKGYFSTQKDHRQDASRYKEFGEYVEKNVKWVPEVDNRYKPSPFEEGNNGGNNGGWNNNGGNNNPPPPPRKKRRD